MERWRDSMANSLKTIDPGDIETYGYEDEVLLMQEITPPQKLDDSTVKLSAEANWLVCEKICIPGSATPQLELPVSTTNQPANSEVFARYRRLLPQNWPESNAGTANWSRVGRDLRLKIASETLANYAALDFFHCQNKALLLAIQRSNHAIGMKLSSEFRLSLRKKACRPSRAWSFIRSTRMERTARRGEFQRLRLLRRLAPRPPAESSLFCSSDSSAASF